MGMYYMGNEYGKENTDCLNKVKKKKHYFPLGAVVGGIALL